MESTNHFYPADLHVHTPSSPCYKVNTKEDKDYLNIIKKYVADGVKLIAITDHNTLDGYHRLMDIKKKKFNLREKLKELSSSNDTSIDSTQLDDELGLFNSIVILPGVEIEVNPGIHILVIFNPSINFERVNELFYNIGYTDDSNNCNDPCNIHCDILELFSMLENYDCIVIGAHVDSEKGIYSNLTGTYRAQVFKSRTLKAMQVNNSLTADKIRGLLKDPTYKRLLPMGYIQATDYHGDKDDSLKKTYFNMECLTYSELKDCFNNPEERISLTPDPETKKIIGNIIKLDNSIISKKILNKQEMAQSICALLNSGFGYIVFGVSNDKHNNLIGINEGDDYIRDLLSNAYKQIETEIRLPLAFSLQSYEWAAKNIYILKVTSLLDKYYFLKDSKLFLLKNKKPEIAKPSEIIEIVQERSISTAKTYIDRNSERIHNLTEELSFLINLNSYFDQIIKIQNKFISLENVIDIDIVKPLTNIECQDPTPLLGVKPANWFMPNDTPCRQSNSYSRFYPRGTVTDEMPNQATYTGNSIIVMPRGGLYYIDNNDTYVIDATNVYPILTVRQTVVDLYPYELIAAWLKSSLLLFYNYAVYTTESIYNPMVLKNLPIPSINDIKYSKEIIANVKKIMKHEENYLNNMSTYCNGDCENCNEDNIHEFIEKKNDEFNKKIDKYMSEIDNYFYMSLNIPEDNKSIINDYLNIHLLHDYSNIIPH